MSFRVDWYCSMAYNFGLIKFKDEIEDKEEHEYYYGYETEDPLIRDTKPFIFSAIREVMRMIESFNLHRIDFRCVSGNPIRKKYIDICDIFDRAGKYYFNLQVFHDNIRDYRGEYHDTICYELIRR